MSRRLLGAAACILSVYAVGEAGCLAMRAILWLMSVPVALCAGVPVPEF